MTAAEQLDLIREGVLYGVGLGVLLCLAMQEVARGYRRWRRQLAPGTSTAHAL